MPVAAVICGETPWYHPAAMELFAHTRTDEHGRFRLAGRSLAETNDVSLSVFAWKPDYAVACHEFWPISKIADTTLCLEPEVPTVGRVLDPQGQPIKGARIELSVVVRTEPFAAARFLPGQWGLQTLQGPVDWP